MALLGFQDRFVKKILRGEKTHTIRNERNIEVGDRLDLYERPRQKGMKLLFRAPCVRIEEIKIEMRMYSGTGVLTRGMEFPKIILNGELLDDSEQDAFARRDGFNNFADMIAFWRHPTDRIPFKGMIIHWDYSQRTMVK